MRGCLCWSGHLVRMDDSRLPKQMFYGELGEGRRNASKPRLRYKDCIKSHLGKCHIPVGEWERLATDRLGWRGKIFEGVQRFEKERVQYASYKRAVRREEHAVPPRGGKRYTCDTCNRLCLSLAGLKSHMRGHSGVAGATEVGKNDRHCPICNRECRSLAGLRSHLRAHVNRGTDTVQIVVTLENE